MKTKTEIQIILDYEEKNMICKTGQLLSNLCRFCMNTNDDTVFRCWNVDHDFKQYDLEELKLLTQLLTDIYYSEEIGFNHIMVEEHDKR